MRLKAYATGGYGIKGLSQSGGTLSLPLMLPANPTQPMEAVTKEYVDNKAMVIDTGNIVSGVFPASRYPSFTGSELTSSGNGVFTLTNTGVAAGVYTKVTVDAKGRVTGGGSLSLSDIPNLSFTSITTDKPTTLAGYGISDGVSLNGNVTMTGSLNITSTPSLSNHVVNKAYVDNSVNDISSAAYSIGDIVIKATNTTPAGFLKCNGGLVNKSSYPELYSIVGDVADNIYCIGWPYLSTSYLPASMKAKIKSLNTTNPTGIIHSQSLANIDQLSNVLFTKNYLYSKGMRKYLLSTVSPWFQGVSNSIQGLALTGTTWDNFVVYGGYIYLFLLPSTYSTGTNYNNYIYRARIDETGDLVELTLVYTISDSFMSGVPYFPCIHKNKLMVFGVKYNPNSFNNVLIFNINNDKTLTYLNTQSLTTSDITCFYYFHEGILYVINKSGGQDGVYSFNDTTNTFTNIQSSYYVNTQLGLSGYSSLYRVNFYIIENQLIIKTYGIGYGQVGAIQANKLFYLNQDGTIQGSGAVNNSYETKWHYENENFYYTCANNGYTVIYPKQGLYIDYDYIVNKTYEPVSVGQFKLPDLTYIDRGNIYSYIKY